MKTPILGITELADGQIDQFATANEMVRALEAAGNDFSSVDLSAGNVTLSAAQFAADAVFRSSGNAVSRNLTIPVAKRLFIVHNNGSAVLSVVRGSTTINIAAASAALLYSDGTTDGLVSIAAGGGGGSSDSYSTASSSAGALALSDDTVSVWLVTLTENITSITLPTASAGQVLSVLVLFTQDGTGGRTVTGWPSVSFEAGSDPSIASAAGAVTSIPLLILGNGDIYGVS